MDAGFEICGGEVTLDARGVKAALGIAIRQLWGKTPPSVTADDLFQAGALGLLTRRAKNGFASATTVPHLFSMVAQAARWDMIEETRISYRQFPQDVTFGDESDATTFIAKAAPDNPERMAQLKQAVHALDRRVDHRMRAVIQRLTDGASLDEIAMEYGCSPCRIWQLRSEARKVMEPWW